MYANRENTDQLSYICYLNLYYICNYNFSAMKERILQFLQAKQISSTQFADTIGVQRSSVSHILSGRNNPSFDFIHKILINYSEIDAEWLILGKGEMYKTKAPDDLFDQEPVESKSKIVKEQAQTTVEQPTDYQSTKSVSMSVTTDIERVVIFFKNNTFSEYHPSST